MSIGRASSFPIAEPVLEGIKRGRYSLLLGAGFSAASLNSKGDRLPTGDALARQMAAHFDLPEKYGLAQLSDAISERDLAGFLSDRLTGCVASAGARKVAEFVWRAIYTFNVDDVLADVYSSGSAYQKRICVTHSHQYQRPEDLGEVYAIHLHGAVEHAEHGFVFSSQQYGASTARESTWFHVLGDEFTRAPFIVVGCSLAEPDLEFYLERRRGLTTDATQVLPSLFVTRTLDKVLKSRCERFGLIPVEADTDSFFGMLDLATAPRKTPLELIVPKTHYLFQSLPAERSQRIFFRQWLDGAAPLPQLNEHPPPLLRGTEPRWEHLLDGQDVIRSTTREIIDAIAKWASDDNRESLIDMVMSPSGEGRSTVLMRVFAELAQLKVQAFYHVGTERLADEETVEVLSSMKVPVVVIVDSIAECAYQTARVIAALSARGVRYYLLAAERTYRARHVKVALSGGLLRERLLAPLSQTEALELVRRLKAEGMLGRSAGKSDKENLATIRNHRDLFAAILSLWGGTNKVAEVVSSEWRDVGDEDARNVYLLIALAHRCGYPLRSSLISRASGVPAQRVVTALYSHLKGIVVPVPPMGEYVQTRHRRLAEEVVKSLPRENRYAACVALASALQRYVNRTTIRAQTHEARLAGRLLDLDESVRPLLGDMAEQFYLDIKAQWEWNSRYWEQRALLELDRDSTLALRYAQHAVGIERHPLPLTTLAKVQFQVANSVADPSARLQAVLGAFDVVDEAIQVRRNLAFSAVQAVDVGICGGLEYLRFLQSQRATSIDSKVRSRMKELLLQAEKLMERGELYPLRSAYQDLMVRFK